MQETNTKNPKDLTADLPLLLASQQQPVQVPAASGACVPLLLVSPI